MSYRRQESFANLSQVLHILMNHEDRFTVAPGDIATENVPQGKGDYKRNVDSFHSLSHLNFISPSSYLLSTKLLTIYRILDQKAIISSSTTSRSPCIKTMAPTIPIISVAKAAAPTQTPASTSKPVHNSSKHLSAPSYIDYVPSMAALAKRRKARTRKVTMKDIQVPKFGPLVKRIEYLWNEGRLRSEVMNQLPGLFVKIDNGEIDAKKAIAML